MLKTMNVAVFEITPPAVKQVMPQTKITRNVYQAVSSKE